MKGYKIFARNNTTAFFTTDNEPAEGLSLPNEYAPHEMARYRKNDFIGELTGVRKSKSFCCVTTPLLVITPTTHSAALSIIFHIMGQKIKIVLLRFVEPKR